MSKVGYFGRDGRPCQKSEWIRLHNDVVYRTVRQYDNDVIHVELRWMGNVEDTCVFSDCWKMFRLEVYNYKADGDMVSDPVEHGKYFPNELAAIKGYEAFIERWTDSHRDSEAEFVEVGNNLAPPEPPKPPNPDVPSSEVSTIKLGKEMDDSVW